MIIFWLLLLLLGAILLAIAFPFMWFVYAMVIGWSIVYYSL